MHRSFTFHGQVSSKMFPSNWSKGLCGAGPFRILRCSPTLRERLLTAPLEAGRVHSVFERAVNILWHDAQLVTLHGPAPLAAPFAAAITRLPRAGSLTPGAAVWRHGRWILLQTVVLDMEGSTPADTTIHPTDEGPGVLASALAVQAMPSIASGLCSPAGRWAQRDLTAGILHRDANGFIKGACALIGLGEGLTPAGDDCLVGVFAVLHRFAHPWLARHPEIRPPVVAAARARTTMVGRDFILHALDGAFSEIIIQLVTAASVHEAGQIALHLAAMGGTSGADTLRGICLALETLRIADGAAEAAAPMATPTNKELLTQCGRLTSEPVANFPERLYCIKNGEVSATNRIPTTFRADDR